MPNVTVGGGFDSTRLFKGAISNVSIYNRVLSQPEIASNYSALGITLSDGSTQVSKFDSTTDTGKLLSISTFSATGTWTKPAGCTNIVVKIVGAGGGGAYYAESGGAGGFCEKRMDVTSIASVAVTIGAGGALIAYNSGGNPGGTSSFGAYCSASGGYGCNQNFSHSGGHGGIGSGGDINLYGGGGGGHNNGCSHGQCGKPGESYWGGGNSVMRHTNPSALGPGAPGTGGCGGNGDAVVPGTSGQAGLIVVWEYK